MPLSPPEEVEALRRDLAQLRMAFVQSAEAPASPPGAPPAENAPDDDAPGKDGPGEERPPIWTPRGEV